ncbi:hypothetical protein AOT82_1240 [Psychrobacter sp. AntiMn-1]|nr:hypothetical protein AOT82_1240 [Psychrobacter sp. AntiMn-1]
MNKLLENYLYVYIHAISEIKYQIIDLLIVILLIKNKTYVYFSFCY